jgi:tetratricopeptide (TPR) repeat protein
VDDDALAELVSRIERFLKGDDSGVLDQAAAAAARRLWKSALPESGEPQEAPLDVVEVLAFFHFSRYRALPEGEDEAALQDTLSFYALLANQAPERVPEEIMLVLQDVEVEEESVDDVLELAARATRASKEYDKTGDVRLLDLAQAALEESIDIFSVQGSSSPEVDQAGLLTNLAAVYITRFDHSGDTVHLDAAVDASRQAAAALSPESSRRPLILSNLAAILSKRFVWKMGSLTVDGEISRDVALDNLGDLDDAIEIVRKALRTMPEDDPAAAVLFANVASWLRVRFELTGSRFDLDAAIQVGQVALAVVGDSPGLAGRLSELAALLLARFEFSRLDRDLDAAITTAREAVATAPVGHRDHDQCLAVLAACESKRAAAEDNATADAADTGQPPVDGAEDDVRVRGTRDDETTRVGVPAEGASRRLLVDLGSDGQMRVRISGAGEEDRLLSQGPLEWPLSSAELEDLRWYLEDYLRSPFGVYGDRGPEVGQKIPAWGSKIYEAVFGELIARNGEVPGLNEPQRTELLIRSESPALLGLPWELMCGPDGPLAVNLTGMSRTLADLEPFGQIFAAGDRLRVLLVISRPGGTMDVDYRLIARPLLERLGAIRGTVELMVLRPPTLALLDVVLATAVSRGKPFHVVHFDGHGALPTRLAGQARRADEQAGSHQEAVLAFEGLGGGADLVPASEVARILKFGRVPLVVLNACQSGAVGTDIEAAIATKLLHEGVASVVAMAYSVYTVAAAEFMTVFYERLFAGDTVNAAVAGGRRRLFAHSQRPSPKGPLPLSDWLVPVHYQAGNVVFPQMVTQPVGDTTELPASLSSLRQSGPAGPRDAESDRADAVFVGRDSYFYRIERALEMRQAMVLYGPGGTGKSALAEEFSRWWHATGGLESREAVLWHSFEPGLATSNLNEVIFEIGRQFYGTEFTQLDPAERLSTVKALLAERKLLLVWDGFETVRAMRHPSDLTPLPSDDDYHQIRDFIAYIYQESESSLIITSRSDEDWLGDLGRIPVTGLTPEEAAQYADVLLGGRHAAAARRSRRAFGELLEWLDGHPQSMRLILPRLEDTDPEELIRGLRGARPLPGTGPAETSATTTLEASIAYSFDHVGQAARRLLPAVSLFYGVVDVLALTAFSAAKSVPRRFAGASVADWQEVLADANRVGLLTAVDRRTHKMHPALPAYLSEYWRLEEPEAYDVLRHQAVLALTDALGHFGMWLRGKIESDDGGYALELIEMHKGTFRSVLGFALDHGLWREAYPFIVTLAHHWEARGLSEEVLAWTDSGRQAVEGPDGIPPHLDSWAGALWAVLNDTRGKFYIRNAQWAEAQAVYYQMRDLLRQQSVSPEREAMVSEIISDQLGFIERLRGHVADAEALTLESLALSEKQDSKSGTASSYSELGILAHDRGRFDEAVAWHHKSLAITEEIGDWKRSEVTYGQLGKIAQDRGWLPEAVTWYLKALSVSEDLDDQSLKAHNYYQLGSVASLREQWDDAETWLLKALAINEELGLRHPAACTYGTIGRVAQGRKRFAEAEAWQRKALAIFVEVDDEPYIGMTYHLLGALAQDRNQLDEAENWYMKAIAVFEKLSDQQQLGITCHNLAVVFSGKKQFDNARGWSLKAAAIFEALGHDEQLASSYKQLGLVAITQMRVQEAKKWLLKSLALEENLGNQQAVSEVRMILSWLPSLNAQKLEADD